MMLLSVDKQTYNEQHTLMKRSTPMQTRTKKAAPISFNDYKHIKDEISEQRFENILTRRLSEFKNRSWRSRTFDSTQSTLGSIRWNQNSSPGSSQ